ncbi:putative O-Antigen ligase [Kyrpidia spormannii]|uniref:Uncharacterized protein n=3 Tax=Kyrpidia spormannii TaxID=2055160 RepID=A0ACA8Z6A7_9BACL|nr:conserved membrane protein of unknown function [Kyrpidia spormannii]CAB3390426.1 putative O-Antigen ligase [Kyrpidia spormannii]
MALNGIVFIEPAPVDYLIMFLLVSDVVLGRLKYWNMNLVGLTLFLFVGSTFGSILVATDVVRAFHFELITLYLIGSWLFFVGFFNTYGERGFKVVFAGWTVGAAVTSLVGVVQYLGIMDICADLLLWGDRVRGLFKDPNVFGPFLIPILLYNVYNMEQYQSLLKRGVSFLVVLVTGAGLIFSFSRGAWLAAAISFSIFIGIRSINIHKRALLRMLMVFLLVVVLVGGILTYLTSELNHISEVLYSRARLQPYDYTQRIPMELTALRLGVHNVFGIGPGNLETVYGIAAQNLFLRILTESGWIALVVFLTFLSMTVWRSCRHALGPTGSVWQQITLASLCGIIAESLVIDTLHWRHLWILLAIAWTGQRNSGRPDRSCISVRSDCRRSGQENGIRTLRTYT